MNKWCFVYQNPSFITNHTTHTDTSALLQLIYNAVNIIYNLDTGCFHAQSYSNIPHKITPQKQYAKVKFVTNVRSEYKTHRKQPNLAEKLELRTLAGHQFSFHFIRNNRGVLQYLYTQHTNHRRCSLSVPLETCSLENIKTNVPSKRRVFSRVRRGHCWRRYTFSSWRGSLYAIDLA